MKILVVTGMPGAGKEEFLKSAMDMNISFLRMGDLVRNAYAEGKISDMSLGEFATSERNRFGKNIWAKRALEQMSGDIFLVDGCRSMDEVASYRELSDDVSIIAIHSSPSVRYQRLVERARDDAPSNTEEFDARDSRELSWGLGTVISLADMIVDNSGSLEEFREKSKKLLEGLR